MNWLLALVGAVLGVMISDERSVLGAVFGFLIALGLLSLLRLRRQVQVLAGELAALRTWLAAAPLPAAVAPASARAGAEPSPPSYGAEPETGADAATAAADTVAPPDHGVPPPVGPAWPERARELLRSWFTEGNVPVKVGVLVLLLGVPALLKYAVAQGYFSFPIEARLAAVAAAAIAGLALGWRERLRRPAFGLSLQGGALGVLLLTVFATYRLYGLLPPLLAFALVLVLVAGSALLALLQHNMALAVLGFLGGYLAPVLISTGSANHVALFSYYALLNAAVFAISWRQSWRLLNLIGFAFTFGVGAAWGARYYRPELFASVEPFLVLFFLFYIAIGLLYVVRQREHRRPWVDGTLVFGTPLLAFPLQAAMLKDDRLGMAFSALVVAVVYAGLVAWLRTRRGERLLTEAYGALALGFATLAVPLAFSASTTASLWALEGAGAAWLGLRQGRKFPWLAGLALQLLAAGAYCLSLWSSGPSAAPALLLINAEWLGAAILSFSGFALSLIHERHRPGLALPACLFAWAVGWWLWAGAGQMDLAERGIGEWRFAMLYLAMSMAGAGLLREYLRWPRLDWWVAVCAVLGLGLVQLADARYGSALAPPTWLPWLAYLLALAWALWRAGIRASGALPVAHLAGLWTLALAASMQMKDFTDAQQLAEGWQFLALISPLSLMTLALRERPSVAAWPRAEPFSSYRVGWFAPAIVLLVVAFLLGLFLAGDARPLPFLPLLNPLELALAGVALLLAGMPKTFPALAPARPWWPVPAFVFVTMATLRAAHHGHGESWSPSLLQSGFSQASLTVVWSLIGVGAWILGSRWRNRRVWAGGAILMAIVLLKLLLVDRRYMGDMPGIVSVMVVGLLLVGVGYIAPSPPRTRDAEGSP